MTYHRTFAAAWPMLALFAACSTADPSSGPDLSTDSEDSFDPYDPSTNSGAGDPYDPSTNNGTGGDATAGVGSNGPFSPSSGPIIISLGANSDMLGPAETLIISAIVTDPDGIDDLIGGQLRLPDGSATLGAFVSAAQEGAYEMTLDFAEVADAVALEGSLPMSYELVAEFFDQGGAAAEGSLLISLECLPSTLACSGYCLHTIHACHPLLPSTCAQGSEMCVFYNDRYECVQLGYETAGMHCDGPTDCAPGLACITDGSCRGEYCCTAWCDTREPQCDDGGTCTPVELESANYCGFEGYCVQP